MDQHHILITLLLCGNYIHRYAAHLEMVGVFWRRKYASQRLLPRANLTLQVLFNIKRLLLEVVYMLNPHLTAGANEWNADS